MPEDKERYYGKNLQQKLNIIKDFGEREEAGHVCFFIEESSKTQAELLEANKKEVLLSYCRAARVFQLEENSDCRGLQRLSAGKSVDFSHDHSAGKFFVISPFQ